MTEYDFYIIEEDKKVDWWKYLDKWLSEDTEMKGEYEDGNVNISNGTAV